MADEKTTTTSSTQSTTSTGKPAAPTVPSNQPSGHGPAHTPNTPDPPVPYTSSHGWGWIVVLIIVVLALAAVGWVFYRQRRARRLGLAPPSLNPFADSNAIGGSRDRGGLMGWIQGKYQGLRNKRTAGGAYEGTGGGSGLGAAAGRRSGRRGLGALDPDEAWDSRVENEADVYDLEPSGHYEEQELSLRAPMSGEHDGAYSGKGYGDEPRKGRGRSELDERYDAEMGRGPSGAQDNPFADHAAEEVSLRDVSPRPHVETSRGFGAHADDSPTERKSMFKENV